MLAERSGLGQAPDQEPDKDSRLCPDPCSYAQAGFHQRTPPVLVLTPTRKLALQDSRSTFQHLRQPTAPGGAILPIYGRRRFVIRSSGTEAWCYNR